MRDLRESKLRKPKAPIDSSSVHYGVRTNINSSCYFRRYAGLHDM